MLSRVLWLTRIARHMAIAWHGNQAREFLGLGSHWTASCLFSLSQNASSTRCVLSHRALLTSRRERGTVTTPVGYNSVCTSWSVFGSLQAADSLSSVIECRDSTWRWWLPQTSVSTGAAVSSERGSPEPAPFACMLRRACPLLVCTQLLISKKKDRKMTPWLLD